MDKAPDAFRTISEVSEWLDTPTYVLRFWESRFPQIKPVKRAGGRRYYRPDDMMLLGGIKRLLHFEDQTIKSVKKLLKEKGVKHVMELSPDLNTQVVSPQSKADDAATAEIEKMVEGADKPKPKVEVRVVKKKKAKAAADAGSVGADASAESGSGEERGGAAEQDIADSDAEAALALAATGEGASPGDDGSESGEDKAGDVAAQQKADKEMAQDVTAEDPMAKAKSEESARREAAEAAAEAKLAADEEAEDWGDLEADMIQNAPYRIRPASAYDGDEMVEIETLYYSLRMVRNRMKRAQSKETDTAA